MQFKWLVWIFHPWYALSSNHQSKPEVNIVHFAALDGDVWPGGRAMNEGARLLAEKINSDPTLLPNFKLGLKPVDTQCDKKPAEEAISSLLFDGDATVWTFNKSVFSYTIAQEHLGLGSNAKYVGFIGTSCTSGTREIIGLAAKVRKPIISPGARRPDLSSRSDYPYFWRTTNSMAIEIERYAPFAKFLGLTKGFAIYRDSSMVAPFMRGVEQSGVTITGPKLDESALCAWGIDANGFCMADETADTIGPKFLRYPARVVFGPGLIGSDFQALGCGLYMAGVRGMIFVGSGSYRKSVWKVSDADLADAGLACTTEQVLPTLDGSFWIGTLQARPDYGANPADAVCYKMDPRIFYDEFIESITDRTGAFIGQPGITKANDVAKGSTWGAPTADALCVWALALHEMLEVRKVPLSALLRMNQTTFMEVQRLFGAVDFEGMTGRVSFAHQVDPATLGPDPDGLQGPDSYGIQYIAQLQHITVTRQEDGSASVTGDVNQVASMSSAGGELKFLFPADTKLIFPWDNRTIDASGSTLSGLLQAYPDCPTGEVFSYISQECKTCALGQEFDLDFGVCRDCRLGFYGAIVNGKAHCKTCPAGRYANTSGLDSCLQCNIGYYCPTASREQISCAPGLFSDSEGLAKCHPCEQGTFSKLPGASSCTSCPSGYNTQVLGAQSEAACKCADGLYFDGSSCRTCPVGMTCLFGSNSTPGALVHPLLKPSFWSSVENPLSVFRCENEVRCPGGKAGTCSYKLTKQSCSHCADTWYWNGEQCVECASIETTKFLYPVLPILLFPLIILFLYKIFGDTYERWGSWQNGLASLGFIILNHYQIISMCRGASLTFPHDVAIVWDFFLFTNDVGSVFKPACAGFSDFKSACIMKFLSPAVMGVLFFSVYAISKLVANIFQDPRKSMELNRTLNAFFGLIFTFFAGIASIALSIFKCNANPNDSKTLVVDRSITCYEDEWNGVLAFGLLSVLFWCFGFGAVFIRAVILAPSRFSDDEYRMRWKFLFIKFRPDVHWFSLILVAKGLLFNLGFVLLETGVAQLFWLMTLISIYLGFNTTFRPWRHMAVNAFDLHAHFCLVLLLAALAWFAQKDLEDLSALDQDMSNMVIAFSFTAIPLAFPVLFQIVYTRISSAHLQWVDDQANIMQNAFVQLVLLPDFKGKVRKLMEWDFWFLQQAATIISAELLAVKASASRTATHELHDEKTLMQEAPTVSVDKLEGQFCAATDKNVEDEKPLGKDCGIQLKEAQLEVEILQSLLEIEQISAHPGASPRIERRSMFDAPLSAPRQKSPTPRSATRSNR